MNLAGGLFDDGQVLGFDADIGVLQGYLEANVDKALETVQKWANQPAR